MEDTQSVHRDQVERSPVELALERVGRPELQLSSTVDPSSWKSETLFAVYVELAKLRDVAKVWLKRVQAALDDLEPDVCDFFEEHEWKGVDARGRRISKVTETWPKIIAKDLEDALPPDASKELKAEVAERARQRLIEALAADPQTEHLVKESYNGNTLRSWLLNDLETDPETLLPIIPEHLEGKLEAVEKLRARVTKG